MGPKLCLTIVDTKGKLKFDIKEKNSVDYELVQTENLAPNEIHISIYKDKILILNESVN